MEAAGRRGRYLLMGLRSFLFFFFWAGTSVWFGAADLTRRRSAGQPLPVGSDREPLGVCFNLWLEGNSGAAVNVAADEDDGLHKRSDTCSK